MSGFDQSSVQGVAGRCFLPERRYFQTVLQGGREALGADSEEDPIESRYRCIAEPVQYDDDLDQATNMAMLAELSGAEAEELALVVRELGAPSSAEVIVDMRVAYAACVRDLHAAGRSAVGDDLFESMAVQLVDPIKALSMPTAAFATLKVLVELLSYVGIELDFWSAPLWIRVLHPNSRVGAEKALRSLVADHRDTHEPGPSWGVEFESRQELGKRSTGAPGRGKKEPKSTSGKADA
jgi:hypothetical protein